MTDVILLCPLVASAGRCVVLPLCWQVSHSISFLTALHTAVSLSWDFCLCAVYQPSVMPFPSVAHTILIAAASHQDFWPFVIPGAFFRCLWRGNTGPACRGKEKAECWRPPPTLFVTSLVYNFQPCYPPCYCSELTGIWEWNKSFQVYFLHLCTAYQMLGILHVTVQ